MRQGAVRHLPSTLCIVTLALGSACTEPETAGSIELPVELAPSGPALAAYQHQPEADAMPLDPDTQPRLSFERVEDSFGGMCDYEVESLNFPAIDERGEVFVGFDSYVAAGGEGDDEVTHLRFYALGESPPDEQIFDRSDDFETPREGVTRESCAFARAKVRARVDELNAMLAKRRWRSLEHLDVIGDPEHDYGMSAEYDLSGLPLAQRPVEMIYNSRKFILRVRQAKVLLSLDKPEWSVDDEPYRQCDEKPHPRRMLVDRASGLGLLSFDYTNGACMCDEAEHRAVVALPAEVFAEVDARPTAAARVNRE